jgi:hypothetical protein
MLFFGRKKIFFWQKTAKSASAKSLVITGCCASWWIVANGDGLLA